MPDISELERIKAMHQRQLNRQNQYNKQNYDRIGIVLKKGEKELITEHYITKGFGSMNEYIKGLISADIGCDLG